MWSGNCMREQLSQILSCFCLLLLLRIKPGDARGSASDSMVLGASLTGNETRISKSGAFELGFFNLNADVKEWYVGIWYSSISTTTASQHTIVWVANREQPLQNTSGVFNLTEDGSLLLSSGGSIVWSSKGNGRKPSLAVIKDSGNLVVLSGENTSEIIWQSFDYPSNTWLPGMKISVTQYLTSWRSSWDPSPGPFSLKMDANQFVLLWKNQIQYWQSGGLLNEIHPSFGNSINFSNGFSNGSYKFITYSVDLKYWNLLHLALHESGQLRAYIKTANNEWGYFWREPIEQCQLFSTCGAYGSCNINTLPSCHCLTGFVPKNTQEWDSQKWSSGCVRKTPLQCSPDGNRTNTVGFVELRGNSMPPQSVQYRWQGQEQCQEACLGNCSCTAYAYDGNSTLQPCLLWFGELLDLLDTAPNVISLFLLLDASDLPDLPHSSSSKKKATDLAGSVASVVSGLVVILGFVMLFLWCRRRSRSSVIDYLPGLLTVFTYREVKSATKNFSERLGGRGFGSVFKGTLTDDSLVAVKKLESVSQGEKQFSTEVNTIGIVQHVNLVQLRGFCTEDSRRLLVYKYMPNGSLNSFLLHKTQSDDQIQNKVLDWKTRFSIAVGTARGIVYLHKKCRDRIIHCDIKPENILLDSNFCPKVADFGLAKFMGKEYSKVLTSMRGTRGYLAPEWLSGLPIMAKDDVYRFGMTLLEIIAGRRDVGRVLQSSELFFPAWAAMQINSGNTMEVVDKKLMNDADVEQVKRDAIVGGWCIQDDEDARPLMSEALQILEGIIDVPPLPPVPLSLQTFSLTPDSLELFYWDKDSASANNDNCPSTKL